MTEQYGQITPEQYDVLMKPINTNRIAKRDQGGKTLSYLESWDVRATLIRLFGFGNFDVDTVEQSLVNTREYMGGRDKDKEMVEVSWMAKVRLRVRDPKGRPLCQYTETAVGSTSGPASMIGEHHDNAVKTAASDALKRCAINFGTQFGLGLYNNGSTAEVVRRVFVKPEGWKAPTEETDADKVAMIEKSLGAVEVTGEEVSNEGHAEEQPDPAPEGESA